MYPISLREGSKTRYGRFFLSGSTIDEAGHEKVLKDILSKCFVVRCEYLYHAQGWEYIAYNQDFDLIQNGCMVPEYEIIQIDEVLHLRRKE